MSVLDRSALEASPLADLHATASELSVDGYRRLRRADLVDAILAKQSGTPAEAGETEQPEAAEPEAAKPAPRRARGGRTRARSSSTDEAPAPPSDDAESEAVSTEAVSTEAVSTDAPPTDASDEEPKAEAAAAPKAEADAETAAEEGEAGSRRRRGRRGGRGRAGAREEDGSTAGPKASEDKPSEDSEPDSDEVVEGVVELLANGSGFVRVDPPDPSDEDVYISSAQVKRCELVSGDRIAGPKRAPRRSERFASLIRIETINGRPASELADSVRFDDLPAAFATERFEFGTDDPTLAAIGSLTPIGKGSRVTIVGAARSGKTDALRRLATALTGREDLSLQLVLSGVRPEEITEWTAGPVAPTAAVSLAASEDVRNGAIEPAIDQARRLAARGADAVVLIDTLDGCSPAIARKALAAARNIVDGGSVTLIATASEPVGGETTVISLDAGLAGIGRFPALDLITSGTLHPEQLVGEAEVEAIAKARSEAMPGVAV